MSMRSRNQRQVPLGIERLEDRQLLASIIPGAANDATMHVYVSWNQTNIANSRPVIVGAPATPSGGITSPGGGDTRPEPNVMILLD